MKLMLSLSALAVASGLAEVRDWTSADGTRTFSGETTAYNKSTEIVTVSVDGQSIEFSTSKLSQEDLEYLSTWSPPEEVESQSTSQAKSISQLLSTDKLARLQEKEFEETKVEKTPSYYFLSYSASW